MLSFVPLLTWLITVAALCALLALPVQAVAKLMFKWKPPYFRVLGALVAGNILATGLNVGFLRNLTGIGADGPAWTRQLLPMLIGVLISGGVLAFSPDFKGERGAGFLKGSACVLIGVVVPVIALFFGMEGWRMVFPG